MRKKAEQGNQDEDGTGAAGRRSGASRTRGAQPRVATEGEARVISLSQGPVEYRLRVSARARRVRLVVRPGGALEVVKPRGVSMARVEETLRAYEPWIHRTRARLAPLAPPVAPEPLADGQALPCFGRSLRLTLRVDGTLQASVDVARARLTQREEELVVTVAGLADADMSQHDALIREVVERWYRRQAGKITEERLAHWNAHYGYTWGRVTIREQKTRWGSCSRQGNLNFNWRLLLAPPAILDYVIIHEMCHLKEHNHGPRFWALVERACPDYKERRRWLRQHGHELRI